MGVVAQGNSLLQAQQQAIQWIGQQEQAQASFLAYMDAFWVLMLISLASHPARAEPAQGQARRFRPSRPLSKWRHGRAVER